MALHFLDSRNNGSLPFFASDQIAPLLGFLAEPTQFYRQKERLVCGGRMSKDKLSVTRWGLSSSWPFWKGAGQHVAIGLQHAAFRDQPRHQTRRGHVKSVDGETGRPPDVDRGLLAEWAKLVFKTAAQPARGTRNNSSNEKNAAA